MIRPLICVVVPFLMAVSALADIDEDFLAAQKALDDTPAYRCTLVGGSSMTSMANRVTVEVIRPDLARIKVETDGKTISEEITDGKKVLISEAGGPYKEESPEAAARFAVTRKQAAVGEFTHIVARMKLAAHETVNGVPASLYTGESDSSLMGKLHSDMKIWISDVDHFPVRVTWKLDGTLKMSPDDKGKPFNQEADITFERDPSIKVALPPLP